MKIDKSIFYYLKNFSKVSYYKILLFSKIIILLQDTVNR